MATTCSTRKLARGPWSEVFKEELTKRGIYEQEKQKENALRKKYGFPPLA